MRKYTKGGLEQMNYSEEELFNIILEQQAHIENSAEFDQYKSSMAHVYHFASLELLKCSEERYLGSGLILTVKNLSGKKVVDDVMIKDGFSVETVNNLLDDFQRSYDKAVEFKPTVERLDTNK